MGNLYANNGYIYAQVVPQEVRRTTPDGKPVVDLGWTIREGSPATINKIEIVGNDVTHERVIREAIVMLPGDLFSRDRLIRSYQNVSNLNFFQQPLPAPDVKPSENGVDVDIVFRVEEKRTGNINFGASLGQGTGVGGFLGLEEPNLFGKGKRGTLQWQFGKNINDFTLSYTDPNIKESRISGTVRSSTAAPGTPWAISAAGSRPAAPYGSASRSWIALHPPVHLVLLSADHLQRGFRGPAGSVQLHQLRPFDPRLQRAPGYPVRPAVRHRRFPHAGQRGAQRRDPGGDRPLPKSGLGRALVRPPWHHGREWGVRRRGTVRAGLTAKSGFIFGDAGPFFTELYSLGGVQFGIPLRGYDEFAITPDGFDPSASSNQASPDAFGESFAAFTVEAGARISQSIYVNTFFDAGNVYRSARQWDPTRLFRGAGFGAAVISPLGPIGVDMGYGFDRVDALGNPDPGWQLHFKLGNFF